MSEPRWMQGPPRSILLATDLSARSDRALDRAVLLAKQWHAHLTVLHGLEAQRFGAGSAEPIPTWKAPPDPGSAARKSVAEELRELAEASTVLVEEGPVVETILRVASRRASGLIAIGVARSSPLGELMLGRTVDGLLRRSPVPVLVVQNRARRGCRQIVVATDFSESSRHALVAARRFFPEDTLTVFHAYDAPAWGLAPDAASYRREYRKIAEQECKAFLEQTEALGPAARRPRILTEYGEPNHLLHDSVVDNRADLVVAGTHGRSAILEVFLGSVARSIMNDVPCDILVVREPRAKVEA